MGEARAAKIERHRSTAFYLGGHCDSGVPSQGVAAEVVVYKLSLSGL